MPHACAAGRIVTAAQNLTVFCVLRIPRYFYCPGCLFCGIECCFDQTGIGIQAGQIFVIGDHIP